MHLWNLSFYSHVYPILNRLVNLINLLPILCALGARNNTTFPIQQWQSTVCSWVYSFEHSDFCIIFRQPAHLYRFVLTLPWQLTVETLPCSQRYMKSHGTSPGRVLNDFTPSFMPLHVSQRRLGAKIFGVIIASIKTVLRKIWLALSKVFIFLGGLCLVAEKAEDLH